MVALQEPVLTPRGFADYAKDFVIMVAVSAVIIAGVVLMKQILPPIG